MAPIRAMLPVLLLPAAAAASEVGSVRPLGVGLAAGEPVAITAKAYPAGRTHAVEVAAGLDTLGRTRGSASLRLGWLWHPVVLADGYRVELPVHAGLGLLGGLWTEAPDEEWTDPPGYVGPRVVAGMDADLEDLPLQLHLDLELSLLAWPRVRAEPGVVIGVRYYP